MSSLERTLDHWLRERYPIERVRAFFSEQTEKRLPPQASWWHTFGSLLIFLVANQIVTGVLLMVYFRPAPDTAFESVLHLMTRTHFGWLIRGLHVWGANAMIALAFVHMLRTYLTGSYKKPRELTWLTGVALLGVILAFGFTGYLLPWNQVSYWATTVGTEIAGTIPLIGDALRTLLRGGEAVGGETLARYYVVHVAVLPWVLVALATVHVVLVRVHGIAPLAPVGDESWREGPRIIRFFPDHVAKDSLVVAVFVGLLVGAIFAFPPELGEKADPLRSPEGIKPEWYFLPTYQLLKYFPKVLGLFVSVLPVLLLIVWPFLDRTSQRHPRKRPWSVSLACVATALALVLGIQGYLSERTINLLGNRVHFDMRGLPHHEAGPAANGGAPLEGLDVALDARVEDGKKMLVASVAHQGRPVEGAKVEFFVEVESQDRSLGQDTTIDDGTAAVAFPEGVPGGTKGELRLRVEARETEGGPAAHKVVVLGGGIPVESCPWAPASKWSVIGAGVTVLAFLAAAILMNVLAKKSRA